MGREFSDIISQESGREMLCAPRSPDSFPAAVATGHRKLSGLK